MEDDRLQVESLFNEGYCCSQIIMKLVLDELGEDNDMLMDAAQALCIGMKSRNVCGAITGGVMMLGIADARLSTVTALELVNWFRQKYGSLDCRDIAGEHGEMKAEICLDVIADTYRQGRDIMEKYNLDLS